MKIEIRAVRSKDQLERELEERYRLYLSASFSSHEISRAKLVKFHYEIGQLLGDNKDAIAILED
jgi:hypothetical protein